MILKKPERTKCEKCGSLHMTSQEVVGCDRCYKELHGHSIVLGVLYKEPQKDEDGRIYTCKSYAFCSWEHCIAHITTISVAGVEAIYLPYVELSDETPCEMGYERFIRLLLPAILLSQDKNAVVESLAEYAHKSWSGWMCHLFKFGEQHNDGSFTINADRVKRWRRQMTTPYEDLPEGENESDREEARKILCRLGAEP